MSENVPLLITFIHNAMKSWKGKFLALLFPSSLNALLQILIHDQVPNTNRNTEKTGTDHSLVQSDTNKKDKDCIVSFTRLFILWPMGSHFYMDGQSAPPTEVF